MPLLSSLYWTARSQSVGRFGVSVLSRFVSRDFCLDSFLDGAKDAFHCVHEQLAAGDVDALKALTSPRVHAALLEMLAEYGGQGLRIAALDVVRLRSVSVVAVTISSAAEAGYPSAEEGAELEEERDESEWQAWMRKTTGGVGPWYLTVAVRFDSEESCLLEHLEGEKKGEVQRTINARGHTWLFSRELPSTLPSCEDDLPPWTLANIVD